MKGFNRPAEYWAQTHRDLKLRQTLKTREYPVRIALAFAIAAVFSCCVVPSARAREIIRLKDGSTVTGVIVSQTGSVVKIRTQGGVRTIQRGEIQWMRGKRAKTRTGLGNELETSASGPVEKAGEGESE